MRIRLVCAFLIFGSLGFGQELGAYIAQIKAAMPGKGSNGFVEPRPEERTAFTQCIRLILEGDPEGARPCLEGVNYSLTLLKDSKAGKEYLVASERTKGFRGLGTYVVDPAYSRNLVLEVPHPIFDSGTPEETVAILQAIGARAMFLSGTHRCANLDTPAGCSGTTTACGGGNKPYTNSDPAHFERNFFTAAHVASLALKPRPVAISIHGSASEPVQAELSDGTSAPASADALVNRLRRAIEANGATAGSCNWPGDDPSRFKLCGGTNVQGRLTNGSPSACSEQAGTASGGFIHIEQLISLRRSPDPLIRALREVFQTVPGR